MIQGSCCCGAVKFELRENPSMLGACHCTRCRKLGAGALVFIKKDALHWIQGKDQVAQYVPEAPYKYTRNFCKQCGSSLGEILSDDASFPISAHLLDTALDLPVKFHEFVAEKPDWHIIGDDAPQFDGHPTSA